MLNKAYVYAMKMHGAQLRASGDPYFAHPIEVAGILTEFRMDTATIVTALLHDVIEDTPVTREEIAASFGEEVAILVEGVTKLTKLEFTVESTRQAENLRKFILAISKDVRVLMVKLADRLHNMRTLGFIKNAAKRERISRETLDVYAPLARAIGVHRITSELEELAFTHLNPTARGAIVRRLEALKAEQGPAIAHVTHDIAQSLEEAEIPARITGRVKQPYSIWRKLQRKSVAFKSLADIYAFRVIVESEDDCYRALGVIHRTWPCVPERFKDYISTPKRNNYRSLHTTIAGARGMRIELQIRTDAMDRYAEEGVGRPLALQGPRLRLRQGCGEGGRGRRSPQQPAPPRAGARARRRRGGAGRTRQARDVPRPGVRLHPQGQADQPAAGRHAASTSPTPFTPTSATPPWAPRSTAS